MTGITKKQAHRIICWNLLIGLMLLSLGVVAMLRRAHRYDALIIECASENGLDPRLVTAVIWKESRFKADAVGEAGEIGLMQVTAGAAGEWAEEHNISDFEVNRLFEPRTNILAGSWYLARAMKRWADYRDPLPYALAEYNAGRSNALRWARETGSKQDFLEEISYPSTEQYIRDILRKYRGGV